MHVLTFFGDSISSYNRVVFAQRIGSKCELADGPTLGHTRRRRRPIAVSCIFHQYGAHLNQFKFRAWYVSNIINWIYLRTYTMRSRVHRAVLGSSHDAHVCCVTRRRIYWSASLLSPFWARRVQYVICVEIFLRIFHSGKRWRRTDYHCACSIMNENMEGRMLKLKTQCWFW